MTPERLAEIRELLQGTGEGMKKYPGRLYDLWAAGCTLLAAMDKARAELAKLEKDAFEREGMCCLAGPFSTLYEDASEREGMCPACGEFLLVTVEHECALIGRKNHAR
ncbi:MAG: hypothetical protein WC985_06145 [Thermoplasmata archaeon]